MDYIGHIYISLEAKKILALDEVWWLVTPQNPLKIIDNVIKNAKPGDIVLLHDTLNQTITSLPGIIDGLYKQGYEFLTIAEVSSFPDDSPH